MAPIPTKPYQLVVWGDGKRPSDDPALRLHFDTLQDAMAALDTHRGTGAYRSGMLMQWDKQSGRWTMVAQFS